METGRPLAAPATPPRGGDTKHVILSGAGSATARALLAPRPRAAAPGSRAESRPPRGAAGSARAEGRGGGSRAARPGAPGPLLPHRSRAGRGEGRGGAAERVSGPRGERHRHLFARLKPARARRSERVRLLPAGGRWPAPRQLGPSSRSSSLRSPAAARPGRPRAAPGRAPGSLRYSWRTARPRRGVRSPSASVRPRFSRVVPGSSCRLGTHTLSHRDTQTHSCYSRGPEEPARRGDPPPPAPAFHFLPQQGAWSSCGRLCCPGVGWRAPAATGWGDTARDRRDSGMGTAGGGLGAGFP